jgi:hypothetical protein
MGINPTDRQELPALLETSLSKHSELAKTTPNGEEKP